MQGGRRAHGRYAGDLTWQRAHADKVASWAVTAAGERSTSGAGDLFDAEWTLVSCQMAVLGLGQMIEQHPELREDYLPAMRACSSWLVGPEARAFGTAKWGSDVLDGGTHAYIGYLALALSMHRQHEPEVDWAPWHDAVLDRMETVVALPTHQIETYPGEMYPADVASVIGALALGGRDTGAAVARFRTAVDPESGLLAQTLASDGSRGRPRGSGTAISAYFLSFADSGFSRELTMALDEDRVLGLTGIREVRPGESFWGDVDSGPVIFGLGVSATGFALAGARMHGLEDRYVRMHRTAGIFGLSVRGWYWAGGSIGNSILLAMMTATRPEDREPRDLRTPRPE